MPAHLTRHLDTPLVKPHPPTMSKFHNKEGPQATRLPKGYPQNGNLNKMKRQRNIQQVKEHDKNQRGGDRKSTRKRIQNNESKMIQNLENKMELQINRLKTKMEKMQEMFNKDLEEIKKSQSIMNNAIIEIARTLEGPNSRITEIEDRISEVEDRMVEINETERKKEKRIKRNEDNLRDFWDNVKCPDI